MTWGIFGSCMVCLLSVSSLKKYPSEKSLSQFQNFTTDSFKSHRRQPHKNKQVWLKCHQSQWKLFLLLLLHPRVVFYFPFIIFICLYDRTHHEFLDRAKTIYVLYVQQSTEGWHHVCVAPSCLSDCCSQSRTRTQRRFKSLNAGQTSLHFQVIYQGFFLF